ncbi:MAG TPA: 2-dehydropantoate 2-reductase [Burkholderiales bacterium]|nr:2-dehydropantoate 2-reductase [Burkholderiales bacterium]
MRIAAMGAGGVGGYFGARLQQAGHDVAFFARGKHLAALKQDGLTLKSPLGAAQLDVQVFEDPGEARPVDVVMFAVKLWDTESAAERLRPIVAGHTIVIPLQNGVESVERLATIFPREQVIGGSAYIGTRIAAPGVIEHIGTMAGIEFGPLMPSQRGPAEAFLAACQGAGISAKLSDDIVRVIWQKFIFLVGLSGATAVARAPLGTVRSDPELAWLFEQAMRETWRLARARGVAVPEDYVDSRLAFAHTLPAEMRASMAHDLDAGNRLEAPWLCGAVARMSAEAGLEAPVNRAVYAALKPFVNGSAGKAA